MKKKITYFAQREDLESRYIPENPQLTWLLKGQIYFRKWSPNLLDQIVGERLFSEKNSSCLNGLCGSTPGSTNIAVAGKWTLNEDVWTLLKMGMSFQPAMLVCQRVAGQPSLFSIYGSASTFLSQLRGRDFK